MVDRSGELCACKYPLTRSKLAQFVNCRVSHNLSLALPGLLMKDTQTDRFMPQCTTSFTLLHCTGPIYHSRIFFLFLSFCQYRPAVAIVSVVLVLMAHWHPNGRTSEAAYFPPFEPRSSPSPICLQVKEAYIYMTSTRFRLQNICCLSANLGYFQCEKEEPSKSISRLSG